MLNGIGDQFVHDESERHRHISAYDERIGFDYKRPGPIGTARCSRDRLTKVDEITIKNYGIDIVIFVQLFVNGGNGRDTGSSVVELACCGARCFRLQMP